MLLRERHVVMEEFEEYFVPQRYAAGALIFQGGAVADGFYWLESGVVRLEAFVSEADQREEDPLAFLEAPTVLGDLGFFDGTVRSASAFAQTDVCLLYLSRLEFAKLLQMEPERAAQLLLLLGGELSGRFRQLQKRLDSILVSRRDYFVEGLLDEAESAQNEILALSEDSLNAFLSILAARLAEAAEELASLVVKETGMGNFADKVVKNRLASLGLLSQLLPSTAYREFFPTGKDSVLELMDPLGTILAILPVSNPTSTFIFKVLVAFKSRNALIVVPNRRALRACERVGEIVHEVLREAGLPLALLQWKGMDVRKRVVNLMRNPRLALILATGSSELVRASYSSGNPAIGVGSGNTPVLFLDAEDIELVARGIVQSKSFDNGLICGAEHNLLVLDSQFDALVEALERAGAAILTEIEVEELRAVAFDARTGTLRNDWIGQSAEKIAKEIGVLRPYSIRLLVVPLAAVDPLDGLAYEKLAPILSLLTVSSFEEGLKQARAFLNIEGRGHTAAIYSRNTGLIKRFAEVMPVSRVLANSPAAHGVVGISTDLPISLVLACGTYGNSSTTDNVGVLNLVNRKRLAFGHESLDLSLLL